MRRILFYTILASVCIIISCTNTTTNEDGASTESNKAIDSPVTKTDSPLVNVSNEALPPDSIVLKLTTEILTHLDIKTYASVAEYFHPTEGVRFSPYGYIDTAHDIIIKKDQFLDLLITNTKKNWGAMDGSGEPITRSMKDYIKRFVYDVKFLKPEKRSMNEFIGVGNSLNNLATIYKGLPFTESHFSGFDKKYGGMDWRSLRFVFKQYEGKYYLVGVVHDEWTI